MTHLNHFIEYVQKVETPLHILLYIFIFVGIVYIQQIPKNIIKYGSNPIVRTLLFGLTLTICYYISYLHALLFALFVVLFLSLNPGNEGFENLRLIAKKENLWFDEQILGEDPLLMENEKVNTEAIQSS